MQILFTWQGLTCLYDKRHKGKDGGDHGDEAGQFALNLALHPASLDHHQCLQQRDLQIICKCEKREGSDTG